MTENQPTVTTDDGEKPARGDIDEDYNADEIEIVALGRALITAILEQSPIQEVQKLLDEDAPLWYQDEDGWSALHAAASVEDPGLVKILLQRGALWNSGEALDNAGNTAGDIALSLNDEESYRTIRDAGIRSELILQLLASRGGEADGLVFKEESDTALSSTDKFLSSHLRYTTDAHAQEICLLQSGETEIGVMMGWERGIKTVHRICDGHPNAQTGLRVLNIGFGLGIIDSYFQALTVPPSTHVIIEPHPDVLRYMRERGWYDKKGVTILEGKWQDIVGTKTLDMAFDAVYTDTFSEEYEDLRRFFDHVPKLLASPDSRFSFFNGLGASNALFYDVYSHLAEVHLAGIGIDIEWEDVDVAMQEALRWENNREYFSMRLYRLPVGRMRATM